MVQSSGGLRWLKNKTENFNLRKYDSDGLINNINYDEQNSIENEKEKILYETISFTSEIMIKLKLSKKFIMSIFEKKIFVMYGIEQEKIAFFKELKSSLCGSYIDIERTLTLFIEQKTILDIWSFILFIPVNKKITVNIRRKHIDIIKTIEPILFLIPAELKTNS